MERKRAHEHAPLMSDGNKPVACAWYIVQMPRLEYVVAIESQVHLSSEEFGRKCQGRLPNYVDLVSTFPSVCWIDRVRSSHSHLDDGKNDLHGKLWDAIST